MKRVWANFRHPSQLVSTGRNASHAIGSAGRVSKLAITLRWPISKKSLNYRLVPPAAGESHWFLYTSVLWRHCRERERVRERDYFAEWWPPWIYFGRHRMGCRKPDSEPVTSAADRIFSPPAATRRMHSHTTHSLLHWRVASRRPWSTARICNTRLSNSASIWLLMLALYRSADNLKLC